MRRRLVVLSLATTALVVIAFTVPLALLVRRQAEDRAQVDAERAAQNLGSLVALTAALADQTDPAVISSAVAPLHPGEMIVLPDGTRLGSPLEGQGAMASAAAEAITTVAGPVEGGWELAVPVIVPEGTVVVSVFVTSAELTEGVAPAWLLLALLGSMIVAAAVFVAYRLGRRLVAPVDDLVDASHRLGQGDLGVRVHIAEPEEIAELGRTFNWLAGRLQILISEEREAVADLSHGLRTPLTSLRLQADGLVDPDERASMLSQVDRLEEEVDRLILRARGDRSQPPGVCDASAVVSARTAFWRVLAEDQGRRFDVLVDPAPLEVSLSTEAVDSIVDALVGNVFNHTPPGTGFSVGLRRETAGVVLRVEDEGPGWPEGGEILQRGVSGAGSTGLGLDIARRTAEINGGGLKLDDRPGGGAVVTVLLEPAG